MIYEVVSSRCIGWGLRECLTTTRLFPARVFLAVLAGRESGQGF